MVLTENEHLPPREWAARDGGLEDWRQRHNDCKPGQWTGRSKSLKDGYGVVLDTIFPLVHELGPRPQGQRQVRAWLSDKRREEDVNALISSLNGSLVQEYRLHLIRWPTPRQDLVIARVRELVDRSLPTFAIPGQRVAFLKLLRGRGVYDTRDGGLSLASFRSVSKYLNANDHCGTFPR